MPNPRCPSPSSTVAPAGAAERREGDVAPGADPAHAEPPAASSTNPFSSFAPRPGGGQDPAAETKLFQVPRELIELARARANRPSDGGTLTPVAPRPGPELEATLRAYVASMSSLGEARPVVDEVVAPVASAALPNVPPGAEPFELRKSRSQNPSSPPPGARRKDGGVPEARGDSSRQRWVLYAAASLLLGWCLYVLVAS